MSHASESFLSVPAHLSLEPDGNREGEGGRIAEPIRLPVTGQGTIGFAIARKAPFSVRVRDASWGEPGLRWDVDFVGASLLAHVDRVWHRLPTAVNPNVEEGLLFGLDPDRGCDYWFSFDHHNRLVRYGKGEMRLGCMILEYRLPAPTTADDPYAWLKNARQVEVTAEIHGTVDIWRDPVTVEVPMNVVPHDRMTMDDMAAGKITVPANLTPTCQQLYDNVAGERFLLDTPDFPQFAEAIKHSISDPNGWCFKTLAKKADEFGTPDPHATYLRITLGQNQGDSPGIPFVLEIWPAGNYSPIHNHGAAEAVIKVLHGEIHVELYRMLSAYHQAPFATAVFARDDVTWISATLNQVHKLINHHADEPCITIQCYLYAATNETHWPYFDYLAKHDIAHFTPDSDADYVSFKETMRTEWAARIA